MTRLSGTPADEKMLPLAQAAHDEKAAVAYFEAVIRDGRAHEVLADLNTLDGMLGELGLQEDGRCPIEAIRKLMNPTS